MLYVSFIVHPNDTGDQIRGRAVENARGGPGASRPRTKESETGKEQDNRGWKGQKTWPTAFRTVPGPAQGHALHSKEPMIRASKH